MAIDRMIAIAKMRGAVKAGMSAAAFIRQMRIEGLSYRYGDMRTDYASVKGVDRVEGRLRFVRKDRVPTGIIVAKAWPDMSKEFMYTIKVFTRLSPGEPIAERFVNLMSDRALTPLEMESQVSEWWREKERYEHEILEEIRVWSAIHRGPI